jgi:hypothetical protein
MAALLWRTAGAIPSAGGSRLGRSGFGLTDFYHRSGAHGRFAPARHGWIVDPATSVRTSLAVALAS